MNKNTTKKQSNKSQKIMKILIILLAIAIVILAIFLRLTSKSKSEEVVQPDWEAFAISSKEYLKDKVIPQHIYDFAIEYTGETDRNEMYEQLYIISRFLPDLCSDLKDISAEDYYSRFASEIKKYLGIETKNEFVELAEYLKENDVAGLTFEYCTYHSGTLEKGQTYSTFQIDFKYENHDAITFNMGILNNNAYNKSVLKLIAK